MGTGGTSVNEILYQPARSFRTVRHRNKYINYYNTMQYMFDRNMYRVELDRITVASNSEQVKSWKDSGKMPARDEP